MYGSMKWLVHIYSFVFVNNPPKPHAFVSIYLQSNPFLTLQPSTEEAISLTARALPYAWYCIYFSLLTIIPGICMVSNWCEPVNEDVSWILNAIKWLIEDIKLIISQLVAFLNYSNQHLNPVDVFCYLAELIRMLKRTLRMYSFVTSFSCFWSPCLRWSGRLWVYA